MFCLAPCIIISWCNPLQIQVGFPFDTITLPIATRFIRQESLLLTSRKFQTNIFYNYIGYNSRLKLCRPFIGLACNIVSWWTATSRFGLTDHEYWSQLMCSTFKGASFRANKINGAHKWLWCKGMVSRKGTVGYVCYTYFIITNRKWTGRRDGWNPCIRKEMDSWSWSRLFFCSWSRVIILPRPVVTIWNSLDSSNQSICLGKSLFSATIRQTSIFGRIRPFGSNHLSGASPPRDSNNCG